MYVWENFMKCVGWQATRVFKLWRRLGLASRIGMLYEELASLLADCLVKDFQGPNALELVFLSSSLLFVATSVVVFSAFGVSMCVYRRSLMQVVSCTSAVLYLPRVFKCLFYFSLKTVNTFTTKYDFTRKKIWHLQVHAVTDSAENCSLYIWPSTSLHCKVIFRYLTQCL